MSNMRILICNVPLNENGIVLYSTDRIIVSVEFELLAIGLQTEY